jgi:chaperone required for assembly of F1-ATPase
VKRGAKRFYKDVAIARASDGFSVTLDGKPIKTPSGNALVVNETLAAAIAQEWNAQGEFIDPETMAMTRYANTVIDRVEPRRAEIVAELAKFAEHDLLCYREAVTTELMRRQAAAWDPWLGWAGDQYGVDLVVAQGVTSVEQPAEALVRLRQAIGEHDPHRLAVLHAGITITGSTILGLAFVARALDAASAFAASRVDESYQIALWGSDAEAEARAARLLADLKAAEHYLSLLPEARGGVAPP